MKKLNAILAGAAACVAMGEAYAAEPAAEAVDFAKYAENIVRVSRITVDPTRVEEYKVFAAEVGRESMKKEPGVRVLYSVQERRIRRSSRFSRSTRATRPTSTTFRRRTSRSTRPVRSRW